MRNIHLICSLLIFLTANVRSQSARDNFPSGARASALSNAGVVLTDLWGNFHNQACLAFYNNLSFGYHFENKYFINDYAMQSLALAIPTKSGTIGASVSYFGNANFNESKISLAFGKPFGEKFAAGVQLNYQNIHQPSEYGSAFALTVEGGIFYKPVEMVLFGIHVFNPTESKFKRFNNEKIPFILESGFGFQFGKKLVLVAEAEKNSENNAVFKAGAEYRIIEFICARVGISTFKYSSYSFGLGFTQRRIKADIAFSHHLILGYTPHISMNYNFK